MRGLPRMGAWRESVCRASPAPTWPVAALRGCGARSAWGTWWESVCRASPAPTTPATALGGCGACSAWGASGKAVPGEPGTYMVRNRFGLTRGSLRMGASGKAVPGEPGTCMVRSRLAWMRSLLHMGRRERPCRASPAPTWSAPAFRRCGACPACGSCRACAARQAAGFQPTLPPASTMACSILPASTGPRNWWATLPSGAIR